MVEVEKSSLRAFKQNLFLLSHGFVQQNDRVGDEGSQPVSGGAIARMDLFERKRPGPESLQDFVVLLDFLAQESFESRRVNQVNDAQTRAGGFVTVSGPDAALGGAVFVFAFQNLALGVQL